MYFLFVYYTNSNKIVKMNKVLLVVATNDTKPLPQSSHMLS